MTQFLRFTVEEAIAHPDADLKEYRIGTEVFDRGANFDPRTDAIVRSQAHRLRTVLAEYYVKAGSEDEVVIEFQPGSYFPTFKRKPPQTVPVDIGLPSNRRWLAICTVIGVTAIAGFLL